MPKRGGHYAYMYMSNREGNMHNAIRKGWPFGNGRPLTHVHIHRWYKKKEFAPYKHSFFCIKVMVLPRFYNLKL